MAAAGSTATGAVADAPLQCDLALDEATHVRAGRAGLVHIPDGGPEPGQVLGEGGVVRRPSRPPQQVARPAALGPFERRPQRTGAHRRPETQPGQVGAVAGDVRPQVGGAQ